MIPRYSRPEMAAIWSPETRFRIWFEIEAHALDAMAEIGAVPKAAAKAVRRKGEKAIFDIARIDAIERETRHDVIAFLTHVAEIVGPEARFLHQGMTSSDVLDTCLQRPARPRRRPAHGRRRRAAGRAPPPRLRAQGHRHHRPQPRHPRRADHLRPEAGFAYAEFARARRRLHAAREEVATAAISGAVGTFANVDPRVEEHVARALGLRPEPISTQVIPRDRHAMYFATLAVVASSVERLATEIRHLQRTEVGEVEEYFSPGQKGSSAMPHKRNPVLSENLTGLARLVRGMALPAMEDVALWHERDISHSSVERVIGPDATIALDFALARLAGLIDKLVVYPDRMRANLDRLGGLIHSQRVLLALVDKGMSREDAYEAVQRNAMKAWAGKGEFAALLKKDTAVTAHLKPAAIDTLFDLGYHLKNVDAIFRRVFGEPAPKKPRRKA